MFDDPTVVEVHLIGPPGPPGLSARERLTGDRPICVDPVTGNDSNDGIALAPLRTINAALAQAQELDLFDDYSLIIQLAAGTYAGADNAGLTFDGIRSKNPIQIVGPPVAYPGVPTAVIDIAGQPNGWEFDHYMQLDIRNIKFINSATGFALQFLYQCFAILENIHTVNCKNAVDAGHETSLLLKSGIFDGGGLVGIGVLSIFNSTVTTGYQAGVLANGPQIRNFDKAAYAAECSVLHFDYTTAENNNYGLDVASNSRLNATNALIQSNTIGVRVRDGNWVNVNDAGPQATFGTGNVVNEDIGVGAIEFGRYADAKMAPAPVYLNFVSINHVGTGARAFVEELPASTFVLPAGWFRDVNKALVIDINGVFGTLTADAKIGIGFSSPTLGAPTHAIEFQSSGGAAASGAPFQIHLEFDATGPASQAVDGYMLQTNTVARGVVANTALDLSTTDTTLWFTVTAAPGDTLTIKKRKVQAAG